MLRAALITALLASLGASLQAQRAMQAGGMRTSAAGMGQRGPLGQSFLHHSASAFGAHRFRRNNQGYGYAGFPYFPPDYETYGYGSGAPDPEEQNAEPPVNGRKEYRRAEVEERPVPNAQVIEIPDAAKLAPTKLVPPTVFVLTNGERLESQRFMLTANSLSLTVQRRQRMIPIEMLDYDATLAANRDRGIELQIPDDQNEISLRF